MPLASIYYLDAQNQVVGPLTPEQVAGKLHRCELTRQTQIALVGEENWRPLEEIAASLPAVTFSSPPPILASARFAEKLQAESRYATFWERLTAFSIDNTLVSLPVVILFGVLIAYLHQKQAESDGSLASITGMILPALLYLVAVVILLTVGHWLYHVVMESCTGQATFGKRLMRLKIVTVSGQRLTFLQANGRYFAEMLSVFFLFFLGHLVMFLNRRRQTLHDLIAQTLVIKDED